MWNRVEFSVAGKLFTLVDGLSVGYELPAGAALEVFDAAVATLAFRDRLRDLEPVRTEAARLRTNPVRSARWLISTGQLRVMAQAPRPLIGRSGDASTDTPAVPAEKPPPLADTTETWFEVVVVDEVGEPLSSVTLVLDADEETRLTTGGDGRIRLDGVRAQFGAVRIDDVGHVKEIVRARWNGIRDAPWVEPAADHTFVALRGSEPIAVSVLSETPHTIVFQPWVVRARLLGMFFDTNKSFLLPTGIATIGELERLYQKHPDSDVLVVGHTDATGEPTYNDPLSLERAKSVAAYVRDDVDAWLAWYEPTKPFEKRWGPHEDELMLVSLTDYASRPPGESAVRWFQRTRHLTVDGIAGPQTRAQLVREYMAHDGTTFPPSAELSVHGCGESFPLDPDEVAELAEPGEDAKVQHRRVELYFFDGALGVQPVPPGPISAPQSPEYPEWVRRASSTYDFDLLRRQDALVIEWPVELGMYLPKDLVFELRWDDEAVERRWTDGSVIDGFRRLVFRNVPFDSKTTLIAKASGREVALWIDQPPGDPADLPAWTSLVTGLLPREAADDDDLVMEASVP